MIMIIYKTYMSLVFWYYRKMKLSFMAFNWSLADSTGGSNTQQGTENTQPLPNPWAPASPSPRSNSSSSSPATTSTTTAPSSTASPQGKEVTSESHFCPLNSYIHMYLYQYTVDPDVFLLYMLFHFCY